MQILIVDSDTLSRTGIINMLLMDLLGTVEITEVNSTEQGIEKVKNINFDLIISEFFFSNNDFFSFFKEILLIQPTAKILVLTARTSPLLVFECIKIGVYGYIQKNEEINLIKCGINKVLSNNRFFTNVIYTNDIHNSISEKKFSPANKLSKKEIEFLNYFLTGHGNKKIGEFMKIKPQTVSTMKVRIFHKLKVSTIVELMEIMKSY